MRSYGCPASIVNETKDLETVKEGDVRLTATRCGAAAAAQPHSAAASRRRIAGAAAVPCRRAEGPMPPNLSRPAELLHPLGRCDGRWAALTTANLRPQPPPEAEQPDAPSAP